MRRATLFIPVGPPLWLRCRFPHRRHHLKYTFCQFGIGVCVDLVWWTRHDCNFRFGKDRGIRQGSFCGIAVKLQTNCVFRWCRCRDDHVIVP